VLVIPDVPIGPAWSLPRVTLRIVVPAGFNEPIDPGLLP
jgi:hypothetical protein